MREEDNQQQELFRYGSLKERVPQGHSLRPIRLFETLTRGVRITSMGPSGVEHSVTTRPRRNG